MRNPSPSRRSVALSLALVLPALVLSAATYLPMSDADLVANAPIVARATVVGAAVEMEAVSGVDQPFTVITLSLAEAIKGSPGATFVVRLPGGLLGGHAWWIPGTPVFTPGEDVVLMLAPHPAHPGQLRLTELGLSKFDIVTDDAGRRFAVRPAFPDAEDLVASKRSAAPGAPAGERDADSFLAFLRAAARGDAAVDVTYAAPVRASAKWVNIGGQEPGGGCQDGSGHAIPCLFRWYWGATGQDSSPNAVLTANGTQSNLSIDDGHCHTDSICDVANAATAWHGVAQTDVRLSGPTAGGNVQVNLDATSSQDNGTSWNTALGCPPQGVIGLGGPGDGNGPTTYRGDSNFYAIQDGTVSMRKVTCTSPPYSAATFRSAVLHEVGHVLGLGHPDDNGQGVPVESIHSTTSSDDWANAVMHSVISTGKPDTPQTDDTQAIQYYYGTAPVGAPPVADFTFSPPPALITRSVGFGDASTGGPTGWIWNFGDPASGDQNISIQANPSHLFATAGTYTVTLIAGNLNGSSAPVTKQVTVLAGIAGSCHVDPSTLCLNDGRFQTTMEFSAPAGASTGTAVSLTGDSGYFWFFDPTNIEVVVKVLDGCAVNGHYWVFAAGLTNVQTKLKVFDTLNSKFMEYDNPQGTAFAPIQDTAAFATCP